MNDSPVTSRFFYGYAIVVVAFMLQAVGWGVLNSMGFSSTSGARILSTVGAVSILGRFVMGGTADRIGTKSVLVICFMFIWISGAVGFLFR